MELLKRECAEKYSDTEQAFNIYLRNKEISEASVEQQCLTFIDY